MINKQELIKKLIQNIIAECQVDYDGLWRIIKHVKEDGIATQPAEVRKATYDIIRTMLNEGEIVAMNYSDNHYHVWNLSTDAVIARIDKEWQQLGKEQNIGDIVWFTSKELVRGISIN